MSGAGAAAGFQGASALPASGAGAPAEGPDLELYLDIAGGEPRHEVKGRRR